MKDALPSRSLFRGMFWGFLFLAWVFGIRLFELGFGFGVVGCGGRNMIEQVNVGGRGVHENETKQQ